MANGNYSQQGGYRSSDERHEREQTRQASGDYRPGDTGFARGSSDAQRGNNSGYERDFSHDDADRSGASRYGRDEQWARDNAGDPGYGDGEQSRVWARESFRGKPSSYNYEPGRARSSQSDGSGQSWSSGQSSGSRSAQNSGRFDEERYSYGDGSRDGDGRRGFMEKAGDEVASWFGDEKAGQRRVMDEHRGKGPKGYQRSDARIEEDVNDRLSDDPMLDASNISVTVTEAEVTLDGLVTSRLDKRRAEDLAEGISGVKHVQNNLRITTATTSLDGSTAV